MKDQDLKKYHILPVKMVYVYHCTLWDTGRLYHTKGKSDPYYMFSGGCVCIYHANGYVIKKNQVDINATETVKSKITFEREAQSQLVVINGYHTNNWVFNALEFMEEMLNNQPNIKFSGDGASHKNGSSECAIKTLFTMSETVLMHSALRCPDDTFSIDICTMLMDYSVWVYNLIPYMQSGLYATEI